jgi:hypothetical protein
MRPLNWKACILLVATILVASLDMSANRFANKIFSNAITKNTSDRSHGNMTISVTASPLDSSSKNDFNPLRRPPMDSVLRFHSRNTSWELIGDPRPLLDFAYIGHSKCGSSTIKYWLRAHDQISMKGEERILWDGLISAIQNMYKTFPNDERRLQGYKQPNDIYRKDSLEILKTYFPKTKLIVGIRHPILWFESFYNFRVMDNPNGILPNATELIGPCTLDQHVCTDHARYPLQIEPLLEMPNPIFLFETKQLALAEEDINDPFRKDFGKFLGVNNLPPPPKVKPETRLSPRRIKTRSKHQIDICDAAHDPVRLELMKHANETFYWIQEKLSTTTVAAAPGRITVSSPGFLRDNIFPTYLQDPCIQRLQEKERMQQ